MHAPSSRSGIRWLSRDTLYYGIGNALQRFVSLLIFPIYSRTLSPADFGLQDIISTVLLVAFYALQLGIPSSLGRFYYEDADAAKRAAILSTALWTQVGLSIPVVVVGMFLAHPLSALLFGSPDNTALFRIAILALPFNLAANAAMISLRLQFKPKHFGFAALFGVLAQAGAGILFVVVLRRGIAGVIWSQLVAAVARCGVAFLMDFRSFRLEISIEMLRKCLRYGLPLVPMSLSMWMMNYANRYFLLANGTLTDVGILGVSMRLGAVITFATSAFQIAWGPFAFSLLHRSPNARETYARVLDGFLLVTLTLTAFLSVFGDEVINLLTTGDYYLSKKYVAPVCFCIIAWGVGSILGFGIEVSKKNSKNLIATVIGVVVNIGLNVVFVPRYGIWGVVVGLGAGNVVTTVVRLWYGQKEYPIPWNLARFFWMVLVTVATIEIAYAMNRFLGTGVYQVLLKLPLVLAFLIVSFAVSGVRKGTLRSIFSQARKRR